MALKDWSESRLARQLANYDGAEAEAVLSVVRISMPDIQAVLTAGGTASLDFTLHDAGHAFRVAERMTEIIPEESLRGLSCYECALTSPISRVDSARAPGEAMPGVRAPSSSARLTAASRTSASVFNGINAPRS